MRAERALCHASKSLVVNAVGHFPDRTVRFQADHRLLAVMIAGYEDKLVLRIGRDMAAAHRLDICAVHTAECAIFQNPERHNALVRDGIEHPPVM